MSKDITVLTPNGRRQKIHCTPDTSILQVLEDVCHKQGFQPSEYDLKHHNKILDLTNTIRFSNLPNKATLEMVETDKQRTESNVTVGLMLDDGERRTAEFLPNTTLYDIIISLAPSEFASLDNPMILYMRQEVTGIATLKEKTLRRLGLIGGRAILRLLNKTEEGKQANVSSIYRRILPANDILDLPSTSVKAGVTSESGAVDLGPGPSNINKPSDPVNFIKTQKGILKSNVTIESQKADVLSDNTNDENEKCQTTPREASITASSITIPDNLERRLNIEEEVTFLGTQKAIVFTQPEVPESELEDLPDDFYELSLEEVRKLYNELQKQRIELENAPLITSTHRKELEIKETKQGLNLYKNVVVRIQFPDRIILQGVFLPTDTITDVINFVHEHLQNPSQPFEIFTTPLKEKLNPNQTLLEAKFVPGVHMHFKWVLDDHGPPYLREDIYSKQTSSDAASILASKYRAPNRRKLEEAADNAAGTSSSKNSKVPKWLKM